MVGTLATASARGSLVTPALSVGFVVMWSSGFIGGRLGTVTASTVTLMVWRFTIVAAVLAVLVCLLRGHDLAGDDCPGRRWASRP